MINEDYCSYEVAKLLKEKGFDIPLNYFYNSDGRRCYATSYNWNQTIGDFQDYSCPTHQMVMKWLREVHGLIISIEFQITCPTWKWRIYIKSSNDKHTDFRHYNKYEDAVESAIKYSLKNLL